MYRTAHQNVLFGESLVRKDVQSKQDNVLLFDEHKTFTHG